MSGQNVWERPWGGGEGVCSLPQLGALGKEEPWVWSQWGNGTDVQKKGTFPSVWGTPRGGATQFIYTVWITENLSKTSSDSWTTEDRPPDAGQLDKQDSTLGDPRFLLTTCATTAGRNTLPGTLTQSQGNPQMIKVTIPNRMGQEVLLLIEFTYSR